MVIMHISSIFQVFQENPMIDKILANLTSVDFRDSYPRFPPIQVSKHLL